MTSPKSGVRSPRSQRQWRVTSDEWRARWSKGQWRVVSGEKKAKCEGEGPTTNSPRDTSPHRLSAVLREKMNQFAGGENRGSKIETCQSQIANHPITQWPDGPMAQDDRREDLGGIITLLVPGWRRAGRPSPFPGLGQSLPVAAGRCIRRGCAPCLRYTPAY
jgi:hypothetical protein